MEPGSIDEFGIARRKSLGEGRRTARNMNLARVKRRWTSLWWACTASVFIFGPLLAQVLEEGPA